MFKMQQPILTSVLGEEIHEAAQKPKPTAKGTPLRYSAAHSCQRQQSYSAYRAEPTEPVDFAGAWVMGMGTLVHEALQEAIGRRFPGAQFEVASMHDHHLSGSCDALITGDVFAAAGHDEFANTNVLYELKTMGTYSFDKQVGWNRMRGSVGNGDGPALKAIAQAGMNALGIEGEMNINIDYVVMGSITFEALSKQKAERMGVDDVSRVMAEYWISRDEWEPLARAEMQRMQSLADLLERGYIGDTIAVDDDNSLKKLSPGGSDWNCAYCQFRTICIQDGPGVLLVSDSTMVAREGE